MLHRTLVANGICRRMFLAWLLLLVCSVTGCGKTHPGDVTSQIRVLQEDNAALKAKIDTLQRENTELNVQIARLTVKMPDASRTEEMRKALTKKETELEHFERRLHEREETLRQRELKIETLKREFYESTNMTMQDIGEAKQIKKEYEYMRTAREAADARANNWLTFFAWLLLAFVIAGVVLTIYILKYANRNRQIDAVMKIIDSDTSHEISAHTKQLIAQSFCRRLLSHTAGGPDAQGS